jgi:hypothetical protein
VKLLGSIGFGTVGTQVQLPALDCGPYSINGGFYDGVNCILVHRIG